LITRVGVIPYLNGKPLIHGLESEPGIELVNEVPSRLAEMLEARDIAAGLVSSVACFTNPRLRIVPGISIACRGPAESVKIFHRGRVEDIRSIALDTSSLTSVLLARIILRDRYGLAPEFESMGPSVEQMLERCDAAVVIGDTTMRVPPGRWAEIDLGAEWYSLTGLPFVFAVWALSPDMASPELVRILRDAKRRGLESLESISASEARRLELPYEMCYRYLSETMDYDLGEEHMEALRLFREKARQQDHVGSRTAGNSPAGPAVSRDRDNS